MGLTTTTSYFVYEHSTIYSNWPKWLNGRVFLYELSGCGYESLSGRGFRYCSFFDRSRHRRCCVKKDILRNFTKFTGKHMYQSLFCNKVAGLRPATLLKKRLLAQVFSYEFCGISKSTFFTEHLWAIASVSSKEFHLGNHRV